MNRRGLFLRLAATVLLLALPFRLAQAADAGQAFISQLGQQAIAVLSDKSMADAARQAKFRTLFLANFDVPVIGKFVLGRYARTATPAQLSEFNRLYAEDIVQTYSRRLSQYDGQTLEVSGSQPADAGTLVTSRIVDPNGGQPTRVDWVLAGAPGSYKIVDVVIENLSMRTAQRDDYSSVVGQSGMDGLIAALKKKTGA